VAKHPNEAIEGRRKTLCDWLTANGIDPVNVPVDSDLTITTEPDGTRAIRYQAFVLDDGRKILDERSQGPAIETRTAPLVVDPPTWWQPHEKPTREQLASDLKKAQATLRRVQDSLAAELHRRQTRYDNGPEMAPETAANVAGELIGLRVALGIALGYPAEGDAGINAAMAHYDHWLTQHPTA
jgi:hypothetical protein